MRRPTSFGAIALAAALAAGCYPDRLDTVNYDAVATVYDTAGTFTATTFALADSVVHLVPPGELDNISRAFDNQIIATVRANMVARGYTEVADPNVGDLAVLLAVSTTEYQGFYWSYWCGYWGWYYPYGCYYPPYWGTYEYTTGSLFVTISDRRAASAGDVPLIWLAVGNGLAGTGATAARLIAAIDQMFAQSPYIQAN